MKIQSSFTLMMFQTCMTFFYSHDVPNMHDFLLWNINEKILQNIFF